MEPNDLPMTRGISSGWGVALAMVGAAALVGILIQQRLSSLETPTLWLAIGAGLVIAAWYFIFDLPVWMVRAALAFCGSVCLSVALLVLRERYAIASGGLHTRLPLNAELGAGGALLLVAMLVMTLRVRHVEEAPSESLAAEGDISMDAIVERIIVYADDVKLPRVALLLAVLTGGCAGGMYWALVARADHMWYIFLGVLFVMFATRLVLTVMRLFMSGPTLVISPNGIFDSASLIATGRGMLWWDEITRVVGGSERSAAGITYRYLYIQVSDMGQTQGRQPLWKKLLRHGIGSSGSRLRIMPSLVNMPVDELAHQINQYGERHAPNGWRKPLIADAQAEGQGH